MTFGVRMKSSGKAGLYSTKRRWIRRGTGTPYRKLQSVKFLITRDRRAVVQFLGARYPFPFPISQRISLVRRFLHITHQVRGYHTLAELLTVSDRIFRLPPGSRPVVVEAGAGSGSSTCKLSLAVQKVGGRLLVFDSFQGIPENEEAHHLLDGRPLRFKRGAFRGRLSAVQRRVRELGAPEVCEFHKGLFQDTLPHFSHTVDVVLLDVDLLSSTRTCTKYLFPRLRKHGVLFSQDGHLRETVELFQKHQFWREEVGVPPPDIKSLGQNKLLEIRKDARPQNF